MAATVGVMIRTQEFLPTHELRRDFRLAGRDLRPTAQLHLQPEPEPEVAQQSTSPRQPTSAALQPVACTTFLRTGLCSDRHFSSSPSHELVARLCELAQDRARSFGH